MALVLQPDITYLGSFRVPTAADLNYDHSGHGLTFDPQRASLFISNYAKRVSEISIPTPSPATTKGALPRAALIQGPTDVLRGKLSLAGNMIGGLLVSGQDLIVSAYILYDGSGSARLSHFRVSTDFQQTTVRGPVEVGSRGAGWVGGNMAHLPASWQAAFGGPALTGQSGISIVSRSSYGPTATVFNPAAIVASPVPGTIVLGYPGAHTTLGNWNSSGTLWNSTAVTPGIAAIEGTESVLWIGRKGLGPFCYGTGANCGDPTSPHQGDHSYPYGYYVWAYDQADLLAVKAGTKQTWEIVPYATWEITDILMPTAHHIIRGVAYDPARQWLFLAEQQADGTAVLIRVMHVAVPTGPPAPPPPPPEPPPPPPPPPANQPPVVTATCTVCTAVIGQPVSVEATASDPDGHPIGIQWSAQSGEFTDPQALATDWIGQTVGTHRLSVTVTDSLGLSTTAVVDVVLVEPPPETPDYGEEIAAVRAALDDVRLATAAVKQAVREVEKATVFTIADAVATLQAAETAWDTASAALSTALDVLLATIAGSPPT